jgi:transcriptional regulator with XRE-family HTH domain
MDDHLPSLIEGARTREALSQGALAALLGVSQQTVSRWETGLSRPRKPMLGKLASVLNLSQEELRAAMRLAVDHSPLATEVAMPLPVRPLTPMLPLKGLTAHDFERFVADLLARRFPDAQAIPLGGQGDDQKGYDILVVHPDGRRVGVQCKREQQFGPKKVAIAIRAAELPVDESVIALARPATAEARFEIGRHADWELWDQADLSSQVRHLAPESSLHLVRTFFPDHVEAFLGVPPANPWMTAEEFYRASPFAVLDHRQPLVARQGLVEEIADWASDLSATNIAFVVGRGGLGKSKLLWEVATRTYPERIYFRFLAVGHYPAPDDFDALPRTGRLVVVLDDAHGIDGVAGLAAQLWQQRPNAKILMAARPYGETQLDTEVWKLNQSPRSLKRWMLDDLSYSEACKLVSGLIGRPVTDPFTRQLAAISADCPFVAVVAADLYRRGELTGKHLESEAALRADVFRRFAEQMTGRTTGTEAAERRGVLSAVAAFQPVRLDDPAFASAITSLAKIESWDEINRHIRELEDAGLLLRRGNAVRVVPDMFGDILLGQAAYDDRSGRATSYLSRAQEGATGWALQHLMVNASRIDWQVGGDLSRAHIIDGLWSILRRELLEGTFDEQIDLLKLVAKIAYYQPRAALNLAKDVLVMEPDGVDGLQPSELRWASTRQDVVHATAPVLQNVAYHLDHLRPALDLLWMLAQDDHRPTNQFPDHPLRILQEIADLTTGKPFEYIHTVIDAAADWLADNAAAARFSPFDVLESILATEGSDQIWFEHALTFYPFPIDPGLVRDLRSRVVDLALSEARSNDIPRAVRAIEALEHGIRGPLGQFHRVPSDAESEAWASEFAPIIEKLGKLGTETERDPVIRIAIRKAIGWHAKYSKTQTKTMASLALASLVNTPEDEVALCLHDGWGRMTRRAGGLDYQEAERVQTEEFRRVARMIATGRTDREALDYLEQRLQIEHAALDGFDSAVRFLWVFFEHNPSAARELCEAAMAGQLPELSHFLAAALAALATAGDNLAVEYASSMMGGDSARLQRSAARALSWNRGTRSQLLPGEVDVLSMMAVHPDDAVRADTGRAVFLIALADQAAALDLLAKIDFGKSSHIAAEALSSFNPQGPLRWSDTDASLREVILSQLAECKSIDEYELMSGLSEMSFVEPLGVTRLLLARISRETDADLPRYKALPDRWEPPLRVSETDKLARCLIEVCDFVTEMGEDRTTYYMTDHSSSLYGLLAGGWSGQAIAVLDHFADERSEAALVTVARILAKAPPEVLFGRVSLITKVLRRAESLGKDAAERIFKALLPTNYAVIWTFWEGQRPTKEEHDRDRAGQIAQELPRGSIERRFFHTLADALEARINWMMDSPEPRIDGRDW